MISKSLFFIFQAFNIAIFALFAEGVQPISLALSGMVSFILYGALIYRMLLTTQWAPSPVILFMVTSLFRLGVAPIYVAAAYVKGFMGEMFFITFDPHDFIGQGYLLLLVGEWLFLAGYFYIEHRLTHRTTNRIAGGIPHAGKLLGYGLSLVLLGWTLRLFLAFGVDFKTIGNLFSMFRSYSSAAGLFLILLSLQARSGIKWQKGVALMIALLVGELVYSLQSYMKSDTIIIIIPLVAYYMSKINRSTIRRYLGLKHLLPIALIAYFVIMILFPYSQARRPEFWLSNTLQEKVEVAPYLDKAVQASIPGTAAFRNSHAFPKMGFWAFFSRNEWITAASWSVSEVATKGDISGKTIFYGFIAIIPRIVWPGKPMIAQGREFAMTMGQADSFETATTSTGLGLAATFYWNGGILLLVAGMLINGMLLSICWQIFGSRCLVNPVAMLAVILLWVASLMHFAASFDGGISFYAYMFIVYYPLTRMFELFSGGRRTITNAHVTIAR